MPGDRPVLPRANGWRDNVSITLAIALSLILFAAGIWDAYAAYIGRSDVTVSHIIQQWAFSFPILPFLLGLLVGHLFWPIR